MWPYANGKGLHLAIWQKGGYFWTCSDRKGLHLVILQGLAVEPARIARIARIAPARIARPLWPRFEIL